MTHFNINPIGRTISLIPFYPSPEEDSLRKNNVEKGENGW